MKRRVVVTGMGAITSLGTLPESESGGLWRSLLAGKSGIDYASRPRFDFLDGFPINFISEVKLTKELEILLEKNQKKSDEFEKYAIIATQFAVKDSLIDFKKYPPLELERVGAIIGSGIGGVKSVEDQSERINRNGIQKSHPLSVVHAMANAAAAEVSIMYGLRGPSGCYTNACATGADSIVTGMEKILLDKADVMIVGGSEAALTKVGIGSFAKMGALSKNRKFKTPQEASRPFDSDRDGFVMGEGAGILVLEELEHAKKRGASIYAEILGYGQTSDAHSKYEPISLGIGQSRAMEIAIKDSDINPEDIEYINSHGTGTPRGDIAETNAIKLAFKDYAYKIPINSTKSMLGHLVGAAGSIETMITIKTITDDAIHPTINLETPDKNCDLDYVPKEAREFKGKIGLTNSFGFGGHNTTIVIKKYEEN